MHIGVTVPLTEFGADLVGLRDFVQAAEDLGYAHRSEEHTSELQSL